MLGYGGPSTPASGRAAAWCSARAPCRFSGGPASAGAAGGSVGRFGLGSNVVLRRHGWQRLLQHGLGRLAQNGIAVAQNTLGLLVDQHYDWASRRRSVVGVHRRTRTPRRWRLPAWGKFLSTKKRSSSCNLSGACVCWWLSLEPVHQRCAWLHYVTDLLNCKHIYQINGYLINVSIFEIKRP